MPDKTARGTGGGRRGWQALYQASPPLSSAQEKRARGRS